MIRVERLNGEVVYINPDLVRTVGARPDTMITFADGSTMTILGQADDFLRKWLEFRKQYPVVATEDAPWK
jgi:uncharacterized protein YlzI (FlbEa/FlbD family)